MSRSIGLLPLARSLLSFSSSRLFQLATAVLKLELLLSLAACGGSREVAVRVSIPGADSVETPAAGVAVIGLPYDRDSVLTSLEARASRPRPPTAALDSLFARFRGPFTAYTRLAYSASRLRDSLGLLRLRLDSLPRNSPEHNSLSARISRAADSLTMLEREVEGARVALDRARNQFVRRSDSLRTAVRQWEDSTYRGYDSIVRNLASARGREAVTDTTDATGWARLTLSRGRWWLYARAWDTSDPNAEWYWNIPVDDDTVLLSSRTGERRPRY